MIMTVMARIERKMTSTSSGSWENYHVVVECVHIAALLLK
jgi:hypothetical protein